MPRMQLVSWEFETDKGRKKQTKRQITKTGKTQIERKKEIRKKPNPNEA